MCRTTASLPKSVLRSSQGPQSKPMITPHLRRAARAVRRVRVAREQRRKKARQIGNTNTYKNNNSGSEELFLSILLVKLVELLSSHISIIKFGVLCHPWLVFLLWSQSQGCRHRLSQHHGGTWGRRRGGGGRASRRLRGSDHAGAEGESSVYIMMLKMHCDSMQI